MYIYLKFIYVIFFHSFFDPAVNNNNVIKAFYTLGE